MASRRKQSKPKAFGINEDELGNIITTTTTSDVTSTTTITNNNTNTQTEENKTIDLIATSNQTNLAPVPTDLLSFNNNNKANTIPEVEIQPDKVPTPLPAPNNKRKHSEENQEDNNNEIQQQQQQQDQSASDLTGDLLLGTDELDDLNDDVNNIDDDENEEEEDDYIGELDSTLNPYNSQQPQQLQNGTQNPTNTNNSSFDPATLMFKCKVCGKGFKHRRSLNRHVRLHSGEKNYKCPHCMTAFARSDHLKAHIRTHNNSKPYRCSVCQCGYNTQAALKVHVAHHHSKSKFKCILCNNLEFHSHLALEGHVYAKHTKGGTEMDLDPNGAYSVTKINHLNESEIDSFYNSKITDINNAAAVQQQQQQRVKLADINNYSKNTDLNESMESNFNYINNNNNEENRENLMKINENNNNNNETMKIINSTDTATIIDNYGEDDDNENNNNSDLSSTSLNRQTLTNNCSNNNNNNADSSMDDIIIEESLSTNTNRNAPKLPIPVLNRTIQQQQVQQKTLPNPPPLLLPANHHRIPTKSNTISTKLNNTYCELCNARFSNPESFQAHMRNCHPDLNSVQPRLQLTQQQQQQQQQDPMKMPYLTSILTKSNSASALLTNKQLMNEHKPTNGGGGGGFIITNNAIILTASNPLMSQSASSTSSCIRPNCNCSSSACLNNSNNRCLVVGPNNSKQQISPNKQSALAEDDLNQLITDNYYAIKETHFTCSQCNLTMYKPNEYVAHLKQEHCVEVFRCVLCKQMQLFDNLNLLKEHFFQEHSAHKYDYYRCRLCSANNSASTTTSNSLLFNNLDDLNLHLKTIHHIHNPKINNNEMRILTNGHALSMPPPPPAPAPAPSSQVAMQIVTPSTAPIYSYQSSFTTNDNNRNYYSNKCFKCNYCESDFAQQSYLNQHIQMVHANKLVTAVPGLVPIAPAPPPPQPPPTTLPQVTLNQHLSNQIFSCQYCRATFANRSQLERHVRIHVSSIDLKCNICDKIFDNDDLLSQHKLIHSNKTILNNNSNNDKPATTVQVTENTSAICVYCKQTIENESMFKEHFKRHNNIGVNNQQQQQQNKANSFICIVCRQTLTSNNEYNLHMRHHLRRNIINNNSNIKPPLKTNEPNLIQTNGNQEATPTSSSPSTTNTPTVAKKDDSSKLRCSKCLVKFEVWQELADHIAEAHPALKSAIINESLVTNNVKEQKTTSSTGPTSAPPPLPSSIKEEKKSPPPAPVPTVAIAALVPVSIQPIATQEPSKNSIPMISENKCEICASKFDSNIKLQCHILIKHEFANANVFTCPVCDEGFSRPENLIQHTYGHGQAAQLYKCTECNFKFVFKTQLINHSFSHQKTNSELINNNNINKRSIMMNNFNQNQNNFYKNNNNNNIQVSQIRPRPPPPPPIQPQMLQQQQQQSLNNNYQLHYQQPQNLYHNNLNSHHHHQNQSMINHQNHNHQQQSINHQRLLFCHECSSEFGSFRHYQHHFQTVHNRIIIQNINNINNNNTIC